MRVKICIKIYYKSFLLLSSKRDKFYLINQRTNQPKDLFLHLIPVNVLKINYKTLLFVHKYKRVCFLMELELKKNILFDVIDGIPPSTNECEEVLTYRKLIEKNHLFLEEEAMKLGISRDVNEFTEDFR